MADTSRNPFGKVDRNKRKNISRPENNDTSARNDKSSNAIKRIVIGRTILDKESIKSISSDQAKISAHSLRKSINSPTNDDTSDQVLNDNESNHPTQAANAEPQAERISFKIKKKKKRRGIVREVRLESPVPPGYIGEDDDWSYDTVTPLVSNGLPKPLRTIGLFKKNHKRKQTSTLKSATDLAEDQRRRQRRWRERIVSQHNDTISTNHDSTITNHQEAYYPSHDGDDKSSTVSCVNAAELESTDQSVDGEKRPEGSSPHASQKPSKEMETSLQAKTIAAALPLYEYKAIADGIDSMIQTSPSITFRSSPGRDVEDPVLEGNPSQGINTFDEYSGAVLENHRRQCNAIEAAKQLQHTTVGFQSNLQASTPKYESIQNDHDLIRETSDHTEAASQMLSPNCNQLAGNNPSFQHIIQNVRRFKHATHCKVQGKDCSPILNGFEQPALLSLNIKSPRVEKPRDDANIAANTDTALLPDKRLYSENSSPTRWTSHPIFDLPRKQREEDGIEREYTVPTYSKNNDECIAIVPPTGLKSLHANSNVNEPTYKAEKAETSFDSRRKIDLERSLKHTERRRESDQGSTNDQKVARAHQTYSQKMRSCPHTETDTSPSFHRTPEPLKLFQGGIHHGSSNTTSSQYSDALASDSPYYSSCEISQARSYEPIDHQVWNAMSVRANKNMFRASSIEIQDQGETTTTSDISDGSISSNTVGQNQATEAHDSACSNDYIQVEAADGVKNDATQTSKRTAKTMFKTTSSPTRRNMESPSRFTAEPTAESCFDDQDDTCYSRKFCDSTSEFRSFRSKAESKSVCDYLGRIQYGVMFNPGLTENGDIFVDIYATQRNPSVRSGFSRCRQDGSPKGPCGKRSTSSHIPKQKHPRKPGWNDSPHRRPMSFLSGLTPQFMSEIQPRQLMGRSFDLDNLSVLAETNSTTPTPFESDQCSENDDLSDKCFEHEKENGIVHASEASETSTEPYQIGSVDDPQTPEFELQSPQDQPNFQVFPSESFIGSGSIVEEATSLRQDKALPGSDPRKLSFSDPNEQEQTVFVSSCASVSIEEETKTNNALTDNDNETCSDDDSSSEDESPNPPVPQEIEIEIFGVSRSGLSNAYRADSKQDSPQCIGPTEHCSSETRDDEDLYASEVNGYVATPETESQKRSRRTIRRSHWPGCCLANLPAAFALAMKQKAQRRDKPRSKVRCLVDTNELSSDLSNQNTGRRFEAP